MADLHGAHVGLVFIADLEAGGCTGETQNRLLVESQLTVGPRAIDDGQLPHGNGRDATLRLQM